jgi:hypothetical protein
MTDMASDFKRRFTKTPCPVCGSKTKNCSETADSAIFCRGADRDSNGYRHLGPCKGDDQFHVFRLQDETRQNGQSHVVAEYDYRDEAGIMLYQVVRRVPKDFRQRRPDGKGGWIWNLQGVHRVLYRLPELLAAPIAEPVFIVEGEKDCDRLRGLGLVATTNSGGAGKWKGEYREALRGRRVVLLPDNDEPGQQHMAAVRQSLAGVAASVTVVELPDLPPKGDVSDWIDAGGTAHRLLEMAAQPIAPDKGGSVDVATLEDLARIGAEVKWAWKGWLQKGVLNALASEAGQGKTRLCADLLRRIRHGMKWPDGQDITELGGDATALWVVADNNHDELVSLGTDFDIKGGVFLNAGKTDPYGGVSLETADDLAALERRIEKAKPSFVIVDTVGNATENDLNKQDGAKAFYKPLQILARRHGSVFICLTHLNAGGQFLGRRVLEKVRVAIRMQKPDPNDDRRSLQVVKTNSKKPPPLGVTMGDGGNEYDTNPPVAPAADDFAPESGKARATPGLDKCSGWLREYVAPAPAKVHEIRTAAERKGFSTKTLYKAKDILPISEFESEGKKWWELTTDED